MKCIIVDDELAARVIVEGLCAQHKELEIIGQFPNAVEALKFLNQNEVDVMFLDMHMPMLTGKDLIETLKEPPMVVLTTSDTEFALEAFGYPFIVDYLIKPITPERFQVTLSKLRAFSASEDRKDPVKPAKSGKISQSGELYINIDRRLIKLKFQDIMLIEAKGDYIEIKTDTTVHRVHSTLKKIKDKLPESLFMQIHRSFIINCTKIIDIQDNTVLIDRNVIPISRSNRPYLMERLNLL